MAADKRFLGLLETDTENERVLAPFLLSLTERGRDPSGGLLVVIDGGKGLRGRGPRGLRGVGGRAAVPVAQARENVVGYLPKGEQELWRGRLQRAYDRPT